MGDAIACHTDVVDITSLLPAIRSHVSPLLTVRHRIHEFVLSSHLVLKMSPTHCSHLLIKLLLTLRISYALIDSIALIMLSKFIYCMWIYF